MPRTRPSLVLGLTHVMAVLIGWGTWTVLRPPHSTIAPLPLADTKVRQRLQPSATTAQEILAAVATPATGTAARRHAEIDRAFLEWMTEFRHLIATLRAPENFESAVAEQMKPWNGQDKPNARCAALMYLWMHEKPEGLIQWAGRDPENLNYKALSLCLDPFASEVISGKRLAALKPFLNNPLWGQRVGSAACTTLGESADVNGIIQIKGLVTPEQWDGFKGSITRSWPWSERSKLVALAISEGGPEMIVSPFLDHWKEEPTGPAWLQDLMRDGSIDAGFREGIWRNGDLREDARTNLKLPFADRLVLLQDDDARQAPDQTLVDRYASHDAAHLMAFTDLNFQFRNGVLDAAQVMARVEKEIPELSIKAPAVVRDIVFRNLIEENPLAAMPLLNDLPPEERSKAVLRAARTSFNRVDPDRFLEALGQVPAEDPTLREERLLAWTSHAKANHQLMDEGYVNWVHSLPAGVDREMALYSLSAAVTKDHPELAASLLRDMEDKDLKQRLTENP